MRIPVLAWLLLTAGAFGQDRLWPLLPISQAALVGAGVADAATSYGKPETNAIVADTRGRFGVKGMAIKFTIVGGCIAGQDMVVHRSARARRWLIVANFAVAGVEAAVSVHNARLPAPRP